MGERLSSQGADFRRTEREGVLTVTFTRDAKLNAVSQEMVEALRSAAVDLGDRDDLRALLIRAEGRFFSAGMDIGETMAGRDDTDGRDTRRLRRSYRRLHLLFDELEAIEKPVVVAVQGPCWGVGLELSSSCDFRLATPRATFALPEVPNLGVIPGSGGISRVTRLIGPHWAKWLTMAGEVVDADRALAIGLVHAVHPEDSFDEEVDAFMRKLVDLPGDAVGLAKLAVDTAASVDRGTARDFDRVANTVLLLSEDHKARVRAFEERQHRA